jgi:hypothetical protein
MQTRPSRTSALTGCDCASRQRHRIRFAAGAALAVATSSAAAQDWGLHFGSVGSDLQLALADDGAGGAFAVGNTNALLAGTYFGQTDGYVVRVDAAGQVLWARQFGSAKVDWPIEADADGSGGVIVTGFTNGALAGPALGAVDIFVARFDAAGAVLWTRTYGTSAPDQGTDVLADGAGGFFLCGTSEGGFAGPSLGLGDAWVARIDALGDPLWITPLGSAGSDPAFALALDGVGGVYACGGTGADLGGPSSGGGDAWLARLDGAGGVLWMRQYGSTADDWAESIAEDGAGGVFLGGTTYGNLAGTHAGAADCWVGRVDADGRALWFEQLGTEGGDTLRDVDWDGSSGVYAVGQTSGALAGAHLGQTDAWYGHFDAVGGTTILRQFGTPAQDWAVGAAIDSAGGLRVSGYTSGSLFGANLGFADAFVARFDACDFFAWSTYCPANANSTGAPAQLLGAGSVRLSDNDFTLIASGCPAQQNGIFLISDTSTSQPFGDGVLCVGGSLLRVPPLLTTGADGATSLALDFTDPSSPASQVTAGSTWNFQFWYRDTASTGAGFNLSSALSATFCP